MSTATLVSRVTGLARDAVMAYAIGTATLYHGTNVSSSYIVANNIPNMIFELVAGGVLSGIFIALFIERMENAGEDEAWRFASYSFNVALIGLGVFALLGTVFAEPFVRTQMAKVGGAYGQGLLAMGTFFFRFFAVQVVFYGMHAIATGVLNSYRRFVATAVAPIFSNLFMIGVFLGLYLPFRNSNPRLAMTMLAIGTTVGVLVMFLTLVPDLLRVGIRYTPRIDWHDPALRTMGRKMIATVVYVATNLVGVSMRTQYAFLAVAEGRGPAAVRYAWMFYQLPYGVFAVALATAFLPELATAAGIKDRDGFKRQFMQGLSATGLLMLPAAALLIGLAEPLVTLLRSGAFTAHDVPLVASVLRFWALGVFSFAAYMFTLRSYHALQDTRTPTLTNIPGTILQVGLYAVLTLGAAGWPGMGLAGIGLADSVFYTLHFLVLWAILRKRLGPMNARAFLSSVARVLVASVAAGLVAWGVADVLAPLAGASRFGFLVQLLAGGVAGVLVAFGIASLLRVPELDIAASLMKRAFGRFLPRTAS